VSSNDVIHFTGATKVKFKKLNPDKFLTANPSQNNRAIWDHTMLLATRHKRTHPRLNPSQ